MNITCSLAIITLAALVHASFQLSVSVLTILSAHTLGAKKSQAKLLQMTTSFLIGAGIMTLMLLADAVLVLLVIFKSDTPQIVWASGCGLLIGVAISIWLFYYRREKGTMLWIPRNVAEFMNARTRKTKSSAEAFSLGLISVFGELLFIIAPLIISAIVITGLPDLWKFVGIGIYALVSLLPLIVVWVLIGSGHSLSRIQKWRENNKYFLQFVAGAGLFVLAFFIYTFEILGNTIGGI